MVKDEALRRLAEEGRVFKQIADAMGAMGPGNPTVSHVRQMIPTVERLEIVKFMKRLEAEEVGKFMVGRRRKESRFEWREAGTPVPPTAVMRSPVVGSARLEHRFVLRPGFEATLLLPQDLTPTEADRLASFVRALPFERGVA